MPKAGTFSIVVAERGASRAQWVAECRKTAERVALVTQRRGESWAALSGRVRAKVAELGAEGLKLQTAVIVGGTDWDRSVLVSRAMQARAMVSSMIDAGHGRLILVSGRRVDGSAQHAMAALASVVADAVKGTGVTVEHSDATKLVA